ncbi:MAG: response regulator [Bacteroidota bacterium]
MNRPKKCLLIDDDQDDQEIFMIALNQSNTGVKCDIEGNGLSGLDRLDKNPGDVPDFIFLDLNMPGMNGKQCLVEIRKRPFLKAVPVIIYSTSSVPDEVIDTKALGAVDFITKPPSVTQLAEILNDFFRKHQ